MKTPTLILSLLFVFFVALPGASYAQDQKNYVPARFEGGEAAVRSYILNHLLIKPNPQNDHQADLTLGIADDGTLVNFKIDGNISMQLTLDLKNVLKVMQKKVHPTPATLNGRPVKSEYQLSIKFG